MRRCYDGRVSAKMLADEDLAARFAAGDTAAFEALVNRYAKPVFNFALNFLGDGDDADEAAQLVFLQMYQSLARARLDSPLRPWIYQIARNKCIDLWRKRRTVSLSPGDADDDPDGESGEHEVADPAPLPDELAERADVQAVLRRAINALPINYRVAVTLRYVNELSFAEIGKAMNVPENTAKTYFQRAKRLLREQLRHLRD